MKIIIGREEQGSRLHLVSYNDQGQMTKDICHGQQQSVNQSVSRQHLSLTLNDDGSFTLENLKMQNITFVNGMQVNRTRVTKDDRIEMGHERYLFDWAAIKPLLPKIHDARPLKQVFEDYDQQIANLNKRQQVFNAMRGGTSILTMGAIAVGFIFGRDGGFSTLTAILYGLALFASLFFTVKSFIDASKLPAQRKRITDEFRQHCVCPNDECRHFLGNYQFYDNLPKKCPHCQTQFIK